jgi:long-chain fatty acid transport protein
MNKLKLISLAIAIAMGNNIFAGGLLTNTNQNAAFLRNPARDGAIGIDGVYSNPAGVAFLGKGLHISFNVQNVYQTRNINSGLTVPSLQGTPFYMPFTLNGGDANGNKLFKGEASVPVVPSIQAALNYENWGFQASFAITGGGGKCTFNDGLGSFERQIAMIPALLSSQGITSTTPGYSVNSYIYGRQYIFGLQMGATYKFNDHLSVYGGLRFNYIMNKYEGNITDISANIDGTNENLYSYFGSKADTYSQMAFYYKMRATEISDAATKEKYEQTSAAYTKAAETANSTKQQFADKYLDCQQTGWGITPIIGVDYKWRGLNIGAKFEFITKVNIQNNTKRDDTGLFKDGVNTPNDLPGLFTIGAQYEIIPSLRVNAGYHYFLDKDAKMANDKQKLLTSNTQEYLAGAEYDINKIIQVSAGIQKTNYGLGDGSYLTDMSFVTSSYSIGFGAGINVTKNAKLNLAYFWTNYDTFTKEYSTTMITSSGASVPVDCSDEFTRTNKVIGVGLDVNF